MICPSGNCRRALRGIETSVQCGLQSYRCAHVEIAGDPFGGLRHSGSVLGFDSATRMRGNCRRALRGIETIVECHLSFDRTPFEVEIAGDPFGGLRLFWRQRRPSSRSSGNCRRSLRGIETSASANGTTTTSRSRGNCRRALRGIETKSRQWSDQCWTRGNCRRALRGIETRFLPRPSTTLRSSRWKLPASPSGD